MADKTPFLKQGGSFLGSSSVNSTANKTFLQPEKPFLSPQPAREAFLKPEEPFLKPETPFLSNNTSSTYKKNPIPNYHFDYNDPYEVNSALDALINTEAKRRTYGDWVDDNILNWMAGTVVAQADVLWKQGLKPLLGGAYYGFKDNGLAGMLSGLGTGAQAAALNTLNNVQETLDVDSRLVKPYVIESLYNSGIDVGSHTKGNVGEAYKQAWGVGDRGLVNYDYDTGNIFTDIASEMLSSPLNWVTFGSKALAKSAVQKGTSAAAKVTPTVTKTANKKVTQLITKEFLRNDKPAVEVLVELFERTPDAVNGNVFRNKALNKILKSVPEDDILQYANDLQVGLSSTVLDSLSKLNIGRKGYQYVDKAQLALFKSVFGDKIVAGKAISKYSKPIIKQASDAAKTVFQGQLGQKLGMQQVKYVQKAVLDANGIPVVDVVDEVYDVLTNVERYDAAVVDATTQATVFGAKGQRTPKIKRPLKDFIHTPETLESFERIEQEALSRYADDNLLKEQLIHDAAADIINKGIPANVRSMLSAEKQADIMREVEQYGGLPESRAFRNLTKEVDPSTGLEEWFVTYDYYKAPSLPGVQNIKDVPKEFITQVEDWVEQAPTYFRDIPAPREADIMRYLKDAMSRTIEETEGLVSYRNRPKGSKGFEIPYIYTAQANKRFSYMIETGLGELRLGMMNPKSVPEGKLPHIQRTLQLFKKLAERKGVATELVYDYLRAVLYLTRTNLYPSQWELVSKQILAEFPGAADIVYAALKDKVSAKALVEHYEQAAKGVSTLRRFTDFTTTQMNPSTGRRIYQQVLKKEIPRMVTEAVPDGDLLPPKTVREFNRYFTNLYRTGFLTNPGTMFRNMLDGMLKAAMEVGDLAEFPRVFRNFLKASDYNSKYDKAIRQLLEDATSPEAIEFVSNSVGKSLSEGAMRDRMQQVFDSLLNNDEYVQRYLDGLPLDVFRTIHDFRMQGDGISGGLSAELRKAIETFTGEDFKAKSRDSFFYRVVYGNPYVKFMMGTGEKLERALRLGQLVTHMDDGVDFIDAVKKIEKAQFNYNKKSAFEKTWETVFPFTGFKFRNFKFYAEKLLQSGKLSSAMMDVLTPILDLDETTSEELYTNPVLRYQVLNGTVRFGDPVLDPTDETQRRYLQQYFKLNPSILDAYGTLFNPASAFMWDTLLPMFKTLIETKGDITTEDFINALPVLGTLNQRYKNVANNFKATGNFMQLIPSMVSTIKTYIPFDPQNFNPDASEEQVKMWYAQYMSLGLPEAYNPYRYYPQFSKIAPDFDPNNIDPNASEAFVKQWYARYKDKNLPEKYNPYLYYPEYSGFKAVDPNNLDPNATAVDVKRMFAYYKINELPEEYNPYLYYPQFSNFKAVDPNALDPNATEADVQRMYAYYKNNKLSEQYNPYLYYPQYSKARKGVTKTVAGDPTYQNFKNAYDTQLEFLTPTARIRNANRIYRLSRPQNFYKNMYTSTGASRMAMRMGKTSSRNLKYRVADIQYQFSRLWYYIK